MSTNKLNLFLSASLKSGVALLPLAIAFAQMPASAQPKTQAQLEAEAAAAKAAAQSGSDADDAAAAAALFGGLTGASKTTENTRDIVVTGTQIRGVAPTGTNLTVVTKDDIEATGQTSTAQLLASIPGFSNFNQLPNTAGAGAQAGVFNRPNLRGTPDGDVASTGVGDPGSSTLILIDGNRQSGAGYRQVATDPESISPALLERVEINTDGASSSYGSDAISGVVNFVTKRRYDGVEISGRLGYADDYWQYDATALAGKDWGSGSFYVSGNYSYNTPLYNGKRAYLHPVALADGLQTGLNCDLPNISIASTPATGTGATFQPLIPTHYYRVNADGSIARPGDVITDGVRVTPGTQTPVGGLSTSVPADPLPTDTSRPNLCSLNDFQARYNRKERYGASFNFFQKITDNIDLLVRGNYAYNLDFVNNAPIPINITVSANNPWRQELVSGANGLVNGVQGTGQAAYPTAQPGYPTPQNDVIRGTTPVTQTVLTNLSRAYGIRDVTLSNLDYKFGGNAEVSWRIDGNWLLKVTGVYDRTTTKLTYGVPSFGGSSFLNPYQDGTAGGLCTAAIATYAAAGGNAAANAGNAAALAQRAAARLVCLNPYNVAATNPAILSKAHNFDSKALAHNAIQDYKFNLDGALFSIPGGKVRVAVGGEYEIDSFEKWQYSNGTPIPYSAVHDPRTLAPDQTLYNTGFDPALALAGSRWIASAYGEVNVPLVSRANELSWIKEFRISVSARYDKYKIFGSSFNPKVGISFKPTNWLVLKGNYNTSFRAPNILLSVAAEGNLITINPASNSSIPTSGTNPLIEGDQVVLVYGSGAKTNLKPQTGNQWSIGMDFTPFRGFRASVNYSHIDYQNSLSSIPPNTLINFRGSTGALESVGLPDLPGQGCTESNFAVVLDSRIAACTAAEINSGRNPQNALTAAQVQTALTNFLDGAINLADVLANPAVKAGRVYALLDSRYANSGDAKIGNLDYKLSYNSRTPWGSVFFSVNGSVVMVRKSRSTDTGPYTLSGPLSVNNPGSKHSMTAQAGFSYGPLKASATLQHSDGYKVNRSVSAPQDRVGDFNVVNTFATWDFKGDNVVERGLQLSLSINNVLNTSPPVRYSGTPTLVTVANGGTLGRLVQIGFNKKF